jgi:hypothetical protein
VAQEQKKQKKPHLRLDSGAEEHDALVRAPLYRLLVPRPTANLAVAPVLAPKLSQPDPVVKALWLALVPDDDLTPKALLVHGAFAKSVSE